MGPLCVQIGLGWWIKRFKKRPSLKKKRAPHHLSKWKSEAEQRKRRANLSAEAIFWGSVSPILKHFRRDFPVFYNTTESPPNHSPLISTQSVLLALIIHHWTFEIIWRSSGDHLEISLTTLHYSAHPHYGPDHKTYSKSHSARWLWPGHHLWLSKQTTKWPATR